MSGFDWRTATDDEVDHEYSPSRFATRPLDEYLDEYSRLSEPYRARPLTEKHTPLLVYVHGGYWQRLSAADSLFNAADAVAHGISLHAVEYTLAPRATVQQMVDQCISDIRRVLGETEPTTVVIAGCSAGAHLAAMCARQPDIAGRIDGVALLSGIYDVRPIVQTPTNDPLGLDLTSAAEVSPQLLPVPDVPVRRGILAVGQHESSEFMRQNREYGEHLGHNGTETTVVVVEHRDHFDLPYDLLRAGTVVGDWVLGVLKGKLS